MTNAIDFNLAKHIKALLVHRNVTKAAKNMGITQPAMSNSLSKLRAQFDDALLVRGAKGYDLTPFANELLEKVDRLMDAFENVFVKRAVFDPIKERKQFTIAVSNYAAHVFAPDLLLEMEKSFPNIRINIIDLDDDFYKDQLMNGKVDLALVTSVEKKFKHVNGKLFHQDKFAVASCKGIAEVYKALDMDAYLNSSHILSRPRGLDTKIIDEKLKELGKERRVVNHIDHFATATRSIINSCHLITLPEGVLRESQKFIPIEIYDLPFESSPINNHVIWHDRYENDGANIWLRQFIVDLFTKS